jgi:hypothetical protein
MSEIVHRLANNIRFYLKTMNRMCFLDAYVIFASILNRKISWRISDHFIGLDIGVWCLTPHSTIFQLYCCGLFFKFS